jgi:hypothetical protein
VHIGILVAMDAPCRTVGALGRAPWELKLLGLQLDFVQFFENVTDRAGSRALASNLAPTVARRREWPLRVWVTTSAALLDHLVSDLLKTRSIGCMMEPSVTGAALHGHGSQRRS